jgi:hypothetical protein
MVLMKSILSASPSCFLLFHPSNKPRAPFIYTSAGNSIYLGKQRIGWMILRGRMESIRKSFERIRYLAKGFMFVPLTFPTREYDPCTFVITSKCVYLRVGSYEQVTTTGYPENNRQMRGEPSLVVSEIKSGDDDKILETITRMDIIIERLVAQRKHITSAKCFQNPTSRPQTVKITTEYTESNKKMKAEYSFIFSMI